MKRALCSSGNQTEFPAEIAVHVPGLKNLNKPIVFIFPKLVVCLDRGFTQFALPAPELVKLRENIAA
jgi:hypothetical protein